MPDLALKLRNPIAMFAPAYPEANIETKYKSPLVPLPTTGAGYRLLLHGLASEELHAILREMKRKQEESATNEHERTRK